MIKLKLINTIREGKQNIQHKKEITYKILEKVVEKLWIKNKSIKEY